MQNIEVNILYLNNIIVGFMLLSRAYFTTTTQLIQLLIRKEIIMSRENTQKILNQTLADLSQFAAIIHQVHWYVRGENFYGVHELMDKFLDEANEAVDEVAERLITIGGAPYSSLKEFAENSKLETAKGDYSVSIESHIKTLISGYKYLAKLYREGIEVSDKEGDAVTADLFTGLLSSTEKTLWMLNATLGKAPELE